MGMFDEEQVTNSASKSWILKYSRKWIANTNFLLVQLLILQCNILKPTWTSFSLSFPWKTLTTTKKEKNLPQFLFPTWALSAWCSWILGKGPWIHGKNMEKSSIYWTQLHQGRLRNNIPFSWIFSWYFSWIWILGCCSSTFPDGRRFQRIFQRGQEITGRSQIFRDDIEHLCCGGPRRLGNRNNKTSTAEVNDTWIDP